MARLIAAKQVVASTGWETLLATESGLPKGTEAIVEAIMVNNPLGSSVVLDFAVTETEADAPVAGDEIVNTVTITTGVTDDVAIPTSVLNLADGQTLKVKCDVAGATVRVFGKQASAEYLVGLQAAT